MLNRYSYVLPNKVFIDKLICVEIYDLAKMILIVEFSLIV